MSLESMRRDVRTENVDFGPHVIQRMWENALSIDQVLDVIVNGTVRKRESDKASLGRFVKFTISRRGIIVVVKDCSPAFIITANRSH